MIANLLKQQKELAASRNLAKQNKPKETKETKSITEIFERFLVYELKNYQKFLDEKPNVDIDYAQTLSKSIYV